MEKALYQTRKLNIIITGPESTGKSVLSEQLAKHYDVNWEPEYARTYIASLERKYTYEDIEHIAMKQLNSWIKNQQNNKMIIYDTHLIITKIWFLWVYQTYPKWIDLEIQKTQTALYLLCYPDLEWNSDPLRENGGEARIQLYRQYLNELKKNELTFEIIRGFETKRCLNAIKAVDNFISNNK